jgi:16S rRNA G966 N2-methylase RsmD
MPSILPNRYKRVLCSDIHILRETRQRRKIDTTDIDSSIAARGVYSPIVVRPAQPSDGTNLPWVLVAGERRLTSSLKHGLPDIPARLGDELAHEDWKIIELEENAKRADLEWQDFTRAVVEIHEIFVARDETWGANQTAEHIGIDRTVVYKLLRIAPELGNSKIAGAEGYNPAYNMLLRHDQRVGADIINSIVESTTTAFIAKPQAATLANGTPVVTPVLSDGSAPPLPPPSFSAPKVKDSILLLDFLEWAPQYTGPRFNFVHMDPPYGINVFGGNLSGRKSHDTYSDDEDVYWAILKCFCENIDRIMTPSSHLMLWFSMEHYSATLEFFRKHAPGLAFSKFPLIWHKSDNVGILPDPKRGPRRIYETALIASREDHLIVKAVSNVYAAPTDKAFHPSTKPEPMLKHFFQMFVDQTTRILDPTCGSGSALRAAEALGATEVLGLERDPNHYAAAQTALKSFRALRRASK